MGPSAVFCCPALNDKKLTPSAGSAALTTGRYTCSGQVRPFFFPPSAGKYLFYDPAIKLPG